MATVKEKKRTIRMIGGFKEAFKRELSEWLKTFILLTENGTEIPEKYIKEAKAIIKQGLEVIGKDKTKKILLERLRILLNNPERLPENLQELRDAKDVLDNF